MFQKNTICRDCVHWQGYQKSADDAMAVCSLAGNPEFDHPMAPVNLDGDIPAIVPTLALVTKADFGCAAAVSRFAEENENLWKEKIPRITQAVADQTPQHSGRIRELAGLLAYLEDYHEAVTASIEAYDPEDSENAGTESSFGDSTMEEMIALIRTLPTIRADIPIPDATQ